MKSDEFIASGILETYAMGHATEQEAKLVVEMVEKYPEVKRELLEIELAIEKFDVKNSVKQPSHLKEKILFTISGDTHTVNEPQVIELKPKSNQFFKYAAILAIVLLVSSIWKNLDQISVVADQDDQIRQLQGQYLALNNQVREMDSLNSNLISQIDLLKKPSMKSIELKGMEVAPDAKAMVYANTTTGDSYLEIMSLPPAPEGMQYQFWGFVDGKPVDAGMIPLEGDLAGIHAMKTIPGSTGYAITLETKGGHPQPAGKIFVMGNV